MAWKAAIGRGLSGLSSRLTDNRLREEEQRRRAMLDQIAIQQAKQAQEQMMFNRQLAAGQDVRQQQQFEQQMRSAKRGEVLEGLGAYAPGLRINPALLEEAAKVGVDVNPFTQFDPPELQETGTMKLPVPGGEEVPSFSYQGEAGAARRELPQEELQRLQRQAALIGIKKGEQDLSAFVPPDVQFARDKELRRMTTQGQLDVARLYAGRSGGSSTQGWTIDDEKQLFTTVFQSTLRDTISELQKQYVGPDGLPIEIPEEFKQKAFNDAFKGATAVVNAFKQQFIGAAGSPQAAQSIQGADPADPILQQMFNLMGSWEAVAEQILADPRLTPEQKRTFGARIGQLAGGGQ